jgi:WXG100 family type VII secretion target
MSEKEIIMTDVQMDYDLMEDMSRLFGDGAEHLQDLVRVLQNVAGRLEDGALLGKGGDALADALRNNLSSKINLLSDKLEELSADVMGAMVALRDGDQEAASRFK